GRDLLPDSVLGDRRVLARVRRAGGPGNSDLADGGRGPGPVVLGRGGGPDPCRPRDPDGGRPSRPGGRPADLPAVAGRIDRGRDDGHGPPVRAGGPAVVAPGPAGGVVTLRGFRCLSTGIVWRDDASPTPSVRGRPGPLCYVRSR